MNKLADWQWACLVYLAFIAVVLAVAAASYWNQYAPVAVWGVAVFCSLIPWYRHVTVNREELAREGLEVKVFGINPNDFRTYLVFAAVCTLAALVSIFFTRVFWTFVLVNAPILITIPTLVKLYAIDQKVQSGQF